MAHHIENKAEKEAVQARATRGNEDRIPRPFADARELERLWAALEGDPVYRPWWVVK